MVVLEVIIDNVEIILASVYFDISRQIETDLLKIEAICMYVHMCVCMYAYMYVCMHVYIMYVCKEGPLCTWN